jgi:hypothetical protein
MASVKIHLSLQQLEALNTHFMSFIMHRKLTSIVEFQSSGQKSRDDDGRLGTAYTTAVVMIVMVDQLNLLVLRTLLNWQSVGKKKGNIKLNEAQAIIFYHAIQTVPVPRENVWLWTLGNNIVAQLDQQLDVDAMMSNLKNARIEIH